MSNRTYDALDRVSNAVFAVAGSVGCSREEQTRLLDWVFDKDAPKLAWSTIFERFGALEAIKSTDLPAPERRAAMLALVPA